MKENTVKITVDINDEFAGPLVEERKKQGCNLNEQINQAVRCYVGELLESRKKKSAPAGMGRIMFHVDARILYLPVWGKWLGQGEDGEWEEATADGAMNYLGEKHTAREKGGGEE